MNSFVKLTRASPDIYKQPNTWSDTIPMEPLSARTRWMGKYLVGHSVHTKLNLHLNWTNKILILRILPELE